MILRFSVRWSIYLKFSFQVALSHVIIAYIVDNLLWEFLRISGHVSIHEQVTSNYLEAMFEDWYYRTYNKTRVYCIRYV